MDLPYADKGSSIQSRELMAITPECFVKFKHGDFTHLRQQLLQDLSKESFAILLGKHERIENIDIINVYDIRYLTSSEYETQRNAFLRLKKEFIYNILIEVTTRFDVDTIIDVHTHPFCSGQVAFSNIDNNDEIQFFDFLKEKFDGLFYGSIVLSQNEYSGRIWNQQNGKATPLTAVIKTQTVIEKIQSSDYKDQLTEEYLTKVLHSGSGMFNRGTLALGLATMREIVDHQVISVVGVGGLGSIIAEHLVHMGFHFINLIDPDELEVSNLNRIVGASYSDAEKKTKKVDAIKSHLERINPEVKVISFANDIHDECVEKSIALSDWMIITTDNHSSRWRAQQLSMKYFVPLISVGVNITVNGNDIEDMSGEVITVRAGDGFCLRCLGRIDYSKIAAESNPNKEIREQMVARGYVTGMDVKQPAVKTLNSMLATMAVDTLINQYTFYQQHCPILVYENNKRKCIYEDHESLEARPRDCYTCNI